MAALRGRTARSAGATLLRALAGSMSCHLNWPRSSQRVTETGGEVGIAGAQVPAKSPRSTGVGGWLPCHRSLEVRSCRWSDWLDGPVDGLPHQGSDAVLQVVAGRYRRHAAARRCGRDGSGYRDRRLPQANLTGFTRAVANDLAVSA